jgi:predicted nucleic acid-binding protein
MSEIACADTNVFVRALTLDDPAQTEAAHRLLKRIQTGDLTLVVNDVILTELLWVLKSKRYQLTSHEISERVEALLNTDGILVQPANLSANLTEALHLYVSQNIEYTDAYIGCWMKHNGIDTIYTFNARHFNRIQGITVKIPS